MVSRETITPDEFFDLRDVRFAGIFEGHDFPWKVLEKNWKEGWIKSHMKPNTKGLKRNGGMVISNTELKWGNGSVFVQAGSFVVGDDIEFQEGVTIESGAWVAGPTILGKGTTVRHGAYVRGGVLTGENAIIGHASEVKSSILLNDAKAPHFAYVGDSILGNRVNLGAGTKLSNVKITGDEVIVRLEKDEVGTGLRKFGAIVGDDTETGCNSVLNPGVLLGKKCLVYPASAVRKNYYPNGSFIR